MRKRIQKLGLITALMLGMIGNTISVSAYEAAETEESIVDVWETQPVEMEDSSCDIDIIGDMFIPESFAEEMIEEEVDPEESIAEEIDEETTAEETVPEEIAVEEITAAAIEESVDPDESMAEITAAVMEESGNPEEIIADESAAEDFSEADFTDEMMGTDSFEEETDENGTESSRNQSDFLADPIELSYGEYDVTLYFGRFEINAYKGKDRMVRVPECFSYNGKQYPVERINSYAFKENSYVEEITLPNSVNLIYVKAFYDMPSLKYVYFPEHSFWMAYDGEVKPPFVVNCPKMVAYTTDYDTYLALTKEGLTVLNGSSYNGLSYFYDSAYVPEKCRMWLLKDGALQSFTGFVEHWEVQGIAQLYYVVNGVVADEFTGLAYDQYSDIWYHVVNGRVMSGEPTLVSREGNWYYVADGMVSWTYTGLVQYYGTWYYIKDGMLDWNYTGLVQYYGTWYYVNKGKLDWTYTGLVQYYSTWYYVREGKMDWTYTGLVQYYNSWYYVKDGKLDWDYTGLAQYNGDWYYIAKGKLDWNYTGLSYYYGTWYYVSKGKLDWNYTGLVQYNGTWYYVTKGKIDWSVTTLTYYNGTWYYVYNGSIDWKCNTLCKYNDTWYYVKNGTVDWKTETVVYYPSETGVQYYVKNGVVQWGYSGEFIDYNNIYTFMVGSQKVGYPFRYSISKGIVTFVAQGPWIYY